MSRSWSIEDRINRCINEMERIKEEVENMKVVEEKSRKEEIEDFFEKLHKIQSTFSYGEMDDIMSIHFNEPADKNNGLVLIAIDKEKANDVL